MPTQASMMTPRGRVDVVIICAGVQGIQLGLDKLSMLARTLPSRVGRMDCRVGWSSTLPPALVLLHHGLDLLNGVTERPDRAKRQTPSG